jgi:hypothetical protein
MERGNHWGKGEDVVLLALPTAVGLFDYWVRVMIVGRRRRIGVVEASRCRCREGGPWSV